MGTGVTSVIALLAITALAVTAEPLKKEILNLPPLIHFTDLFNKEHHKLTKLLETHSGKKNWQSNPPQWPSYPPHWPPTYPPHWPPTYPPSNPTYPPYPQQPAYPPQPTYPSYPPYPAPGYPGYPPQPGYPPHSGYPPQTGIPPRPPTPNPYPPTNPQPYPQPNPQPYPLPTYPSQTSYPPYPPYPSYAANPSYPPYPQYPPPRQHDAEVVERYYKLNDDGSKEYKLLLSNGLIIYQKILNTNGDKEDIQMLEGYYADKRDDNTFLITHFRADQNGYSASSETGESPPSYPDEKLMKRLPIPSSTKDMEE